MPNRPGLRNKPSDQGRPGSFNRQGNPNRPGMPNNRPGSKFNGQNSSGIRKPVSPNELLQLQKNNNSEKDKPGIKNNCLLYTSPSPRD